LIVQLYQAAQQANLPSTS